MQLGNGSGSHRSSFFATKQLMSSLLAEQVSLIHSLRPLPVRVTRKLGGGGGKRGRRDLHRSHVP
jgi:hypothetical protein